MKCRRCHRVMTVDAYMDLGTSENSLWLRRWRCGNCGEIDGPELFLKRIVHRNWWHRVMDRLVGKQIRRDQLMALTG